MDDSVYCAGSKMTKPEMVRAWMAFRDLHRAGNVRVVFCDDLRDLKSARKAGWDLGLFGSEDKYRARMCEHPWDFHVGFGLERRP